MDHKKRHIFFLSDGTGLTAETLGYSLLTQFENIEFESTTLPYIDSLAKADKVIQLINQRQQESGVQPLLFATFANHEIRDLIQQSQGLLLDFLQTFITPLETALDKKSSHRVGKTHGMVDSHRYQHRIDAINFSLSTDDGAGLQQYKNADIILIGISRSGKTPTSLYLALQFGIFVSNYPLTEDELQTHILPETLHQYKHKLFGLTIDCERLIAIRSERLPDSQYASRKTCEQELKAVEHIYQRENIPFLNSTYLSIEELATKILAMTGLKRGI